MELFPAIDLHDGVAVRLVQGDFSRQRTYGDPVELAKNYAAGGARWIHVVDLDAALTGRPVNRAAVLSIVDAVDIAVQVGGGVRSRQEAAALLGGGVARVVLGTAAVRNPDLVDDLSRAYPGQVVVGLDHRGGGADVAVAGWEDDGGVTLNDVLARLIPLPLAAVVVTAIERDGTMDGPDVEGLRRVLAGSPHGVVASGGVRGAEDLMTLARLQVDDRGLAGAIVGTALVEGAVSIEEALAACTVSG
jgi:phosphoribosylformimino-5-aminoimidazole carboxamide ribotide isomerase